MKNKITFNGETWEEIDFDEFRLIHNRINYKVIRLEVTTGDDIEFHYFKKSKSQSLETKGYGESADPSDIQKSEKSPDTQLPEREITRIANLASDYTDKSPSEFTYDEISKAIQIAYRLGIMYKDSSPQNRLKNPSIAGKNQTGMGADKVDGESNPTRSQVPSGDTLFPDILSLIQRADTNILAGTDLYQHKYDIKEVGAIIVEALKYSQSPSDSQKGISQDNGNLDRRDTSICTCGHEKEIHHINVGEVYYCSIIDCPCKKFQSKAQDLPYAYNYPELKEQSPPLVFEDADLEIKIEVNKDEIRVGNIYNSQPICIFSNPRFLPLLIKAVDAWKELQK